MSAPDAAVVAPVTRGGATGAGTAGPGPRDAGRTPPTGTDPRGRPVRWDLVGLAGAFALSRMVGALVGVRMDASVLTGTRLTDQWQLLDVAVLRHHLVEGVWHLNMQPPLYNLAAGAVLHLPGGLQGPAEVAGSLAFGLALVLGTYLLLAELRVPRRVALGVTLVGVVASPAFLLYANWFNYAEPTAACGIVGAWCLARFLRTARVATGVCAFAAYAGVVLLDSTYQIEWLAGIVVLALVALRPRWRTVVVAAAVPLLVVTGWYAKNLVLFGTTTTSSWFGMNLARSVLYRAPAGRVAELQRTGVLGPLASIPPFASPAVYVPRFAAARPNPDPALGARYKANGAPNFNNPLYVTVSSQYLHEDLAWIRANPGRYARDVAGSVRLWLVGTDQNFTDSPNWPHVAPYARLYDRVVEWQPAEDPAPGLAVFDRSRWQWSWLSLQTTAVTLLALVAAPVLAWRRRRRDPAVAGALAVLWWTALYAFAASSLVEIGENERFRFELGPVPLVLATVVVTEAVRSVAARRRARRAAPTPDVGPEGTGAERARPAWPVGP